MPGFLVRPMPRFVAGNASLAAAMERCRKAIPGRGLALGWYAAPGATRMALDLTPVRFKREGELASFNEAAVHTCHVSATLLAFTRLSVRHESTHLR